MVRILPVQRDTHKQTNDKTKKTIIIDKCGAGDCDAYCIRADTER
jgi:hypothetical protein